MYALTLQHLQGSLGESDENTIVDLQQAQELQRLALLGIDLVDTFDANNESQLRLRRDVEAVALLGFAGQPYPFPLCVAIFLDVLLSPCEDDLSLLLAFVYIMSAQFLSMRCVMRIERAIVSFPKDG